MSHLPSISPRSLRFSGLMALGFAFAFSGATLAVPDAAEAQSARKGEASSKAKRKAGEASARRGARGGEGAQKAPSGPLVVTVSLNRQRLTVYDATQAIASAPISSGRRGHATPTGVFSVVQKRRHHISNIYNVAMPNMQRLTWSGIALHAGVLPGYPASSGCIRLSHAFSRQFFGMTKLGTRVIVTRDPVTPKMIAHERLFGAYPDADMVAKGDVDAGPTQVADASHATGGASDAVSEMLGVSSAHAAEGSADDVMLSTPRQRFLAQRAAEEAERARAIRTAGYAWAGKRGLLTQAERDAEAKRAPFKAARAEAEQIEGELAEIENAVARAEREIARLENPQPPAKGKRKSRKAKQTSLSAEERAARIDELRREIADAAPEIAALRTAAETAGRARAAAETAAREADGKLKAARAEAADAKAALDAAMAAEDAAKAREAKRDLPVSVFISRARQRLYVRQGYDDIFDVEVSFRDPDAPIGTHVFTALDYAPEIGGMSWNVVSVPYDPQRSAAAKTQSKGKPAPNARDGAGSGRSAQTAAAALERIDIPEYAREAIADVMKPGSSVVISDLRMSNETGKYTDFIATIR